MFKYIISEASKIKKKNNNKISLSDPRPVRDFGFAGDFMEAAYRILSYKKPQDFIIATGKSISVRKLAKKIINMMKISPSKIRYRMDDRNYVNLIKKALIRKIQKKTSWKPKTSLEQLILMMIKAENK